MNGMGMLATHPAELCARDVRLFRESRAGYIGPVGRVGGGYDNVQAESIISLFKTEAIMFLGPRKSAGRVEWETLNRRPPSDMNGLA